jgi:methionyl-tRNA formyltransferase
VTRLRNIVFAYHAIGVVCLAELLATGDEVALVITHGDRPDENVWWPSVRELAQRCDVPVLEDADVNSTDLAVRLRAHAPDFLFSFTYRTLLPRELLKIPRRGALNLHPSTLPKYRGRSPLNWVLVHGEAETGVSLHYMVEKPDRGDIVAQRRFPIGEDDTALSLHRRATDEARALFREIYPSLRDGRAPRMPQDQSQASYYGGRTPEDGKIDWRWPARKIYDLLRAVTHPYPGAFTMHTGHRLFVWWGRPEENRLDLLPGCLEVAVDGVRVGTGRGALRLERVQVEGKPESDACGWATAVGARSGHQLGECV